MSVRGTAPDVALVAVTPGDDDTVRLTVEPPGPCVVIASEIGAATEERRTEGSGGEGGGGGGERSGDEGLPTGVIEADAEAGAAVVTATSPLPMVLVVEHEDDAGAGWAIGVAGSPWWNVDAP